MIQYRAARNAALQIQEYFYTLRYAESFTKSLRQ
jgi:hypothetical protein